MNVGKISSSGPVQISTQQNAERSKQQVELQKQKVKLTVPDIKETRTILNEITNNTRFSYSINEKIDSFVVKIIDRSTDKVVKEIPSRELQTLHENLREAIGIFIDKMV
ncbi:flagellar protein FlaG [Oceanispirochaeta crateris]|jgi:flagellar protein FlaG|uniref:Flagellar protein FlaG n=1 Tax=Oceanispirochaeta crateris TaxID=2518645 RepID=A0A5C1QI14_9SPIO|nr:flagellar protein FlaG [Oceanispirochaeta crateris]QEN07211.1 flagellar protein FlaG [Oceanispirochaeta crateris]